MNIPNMLSVFRITLVPLFIVVYFSPFPTAKIIGLVIVLVAYFTDVLDGFLARRLGQITDLGKILDPLADKLMQIAGIICAAVQYPQIIWVVIILFVKDLLLGIGALLLSKKKIVSQANWFGKIASFVNVLFLLSLLLPMNIPDRILLFISLLVVAFNAMALVSYFIAFLKFSNSTTA